MEVLAIIPARGGSKGIPRKNIKLINGKPLIAHTIIPALNTPCLSRVVLSTEDKEISEIAQKYGAEVVPRPFELAMDETKTIDVMLQVVDYLEQKENYHPDVVILLQATCPLKTEVQIQEAFELFKNTDCDSVFAVQKRGWTHGLWRENYDGSLMGLYEYRTRPRRQDVERHYNLLAETGDIYIIKTDVMKKVHDFVGEKPVPYFISQALDIDTPKDFENVAKLLSARENK